MQKKGSAKILTRNYKHFSKKSLDFSSLHCVRNDDETKKAALFRTAFKTRGQVAVRNSNQFMGELIDFISPVKIGIVEFSRYVAAFASF